jgi:hypothetical protein
MKRGGFLPGYILFAYAGSKPFYGGMIEATQDPDAFIFEGALNNQVSEFKTKLEELMRAAKASKSNVAPVSLADELSKLVTLRDSGVLSQDEFDAAKRKLLSG